MPLPQKLNGAEDGVSLWRNDLRQTGRSQSREPSKKFNQKGSAGKKNSSRFSCYTQNKHSSSNNVLINDSISLNHHPNSPNTTAALAMT